jgi:hypothetical protein
LSGRILAVREKGVLRIVLRIEINEKHGPFTAFDLVNVDQGM